MDRHNPFSSRTHMNVVSKFEQYLIAAREPWRVRSWHVVCALGFIEWADDALASSGGWKTLMVQDRDVLATCRERYLSVAIADRDLRGEERLRLNRFIRFVEASIRKETSESDMLFHAVTCSASRDHHPTV